MFLNFLLILVCGRFANKCNCNYFKNLYSPLTYIATLKKKGMEIRYYLPKQVLAMMNKECDPLYVKVGFKKSDLN